MQLYKLYILYYSCNYRAYLWMILATQTERRGRGGGGILLLPLKGEGGGERNLALIQIVWERQFRNKRKFAINGTYNMSIEFWEKKKSLIMLRKQPLISNSEMSQFSSSSYPNLLHAEDTLGTIYSLFSLETLSRCLFLSLSLSLCASYIRDVLILYLSDIHFEKKKPFCLFGVWKKLLWVLFLLPACLVLCLCC